MKLVKFVKLIFCVIKIEHGELGCKGYYPQALRLDLPHLHVQILHSVCLQLTHIVTIEIVISHLVGQLEVCVAVTRAKAISCQVKITLVVMIRKNLTVTSVQVR